MPELSELAQRIISELEEAGAENVSSTMNTVMTVTGSVEEIERFQAAIGELIRDEFVGIAYMNKESGKLEAVSKREAVEVVGRFRELVKFDAGQNIWIWDETQPWAEIMATAPGLAKAEDILEERGYQWWREEK